MSEQGYRPLTDEFGPACPKDLPLAKTDWKWKRWGAILSGGRFQGRSARGWYEKIGERQPNRCGGCQYGRRPAAAAGPVRGRKLQRAGLPGCDSEPRVLLEWAMGPAQISLSLPLLFRRLSGILGEWRCGERSRCRILRSSFPCRLWISRCFARRVRSDWCLPCSE
jgi:hypothetical protein